MKENDLGEGVGNLRAHLHLETEVKLVCSSLGVTHLLL